MATKKASPAQIAARKLFAARAKAGEFAPRSTRAKTEKSTKHFAPGSGVEAAEAALRIAKKTAARKTNPAARPAKSNLEKAAAYLNRLIKSGVEYPDAEFSASGKYGVTGAAVRRLYDAQFINNHPGSRKKNPASATSMKRLMNPRMRMTMGETATGRMMNPKVRYSNQAKNLKGESRVAYAVHQSSIPSYNAIAYYSKKADAVHVAQEASDRTGKQLAVSRVQIYFGAE
jgi:hypothetical protein